MANIDFTVTVTDVQATRTQAAFGRWVTPFNIVNGIPVTIGPPVWTPASGAQMKQIIKDFLHSQVTAHETRLMAQTKTDTVSAEVW